MWFGVILLVATGSAIEISDEEYARFPRLYHLDDYSTCLAKTGGVYCLGSFHIQQPKHHDPIYELMKEYSTDPYHFNRTLIHRGYCVSDRCPSSERNTTLRFQHCGERWGRKRRLQLSLTSLKYCKTHAQEFARRENPEPYDLAQKILLYVIAGICVANVVGTVYDVLSGEGEKRNELLAVWSLRSNFRRLTATYEGGEPRLNALMPLQGVRCLLMFFIIGTHSGCIHDMLFLQNPRFVEKVSRNPIFMIFMNGTSVVMVFVMLSSFLLAYNLLLLSKKRLLNNTMLPFCMLKRVARMAPINLLVVGWAATLWPSMRGGPMWPTLVEAESKICRDKFWSQAFFINNLVKPDDHCLVQTWFLATDMQLYLVACVLTLYFVNARRFALPALVLLTVLSCALNGALAYVFQWKSLMYHVFPSTMHTMYHGVESFYRMYTTPWGSLPACLVGLCLAHLHFEMEERNINPAHYRLFRWVYYSSVPLIVCWLISGNWLRDITDPVFTSLYVAIERPVPSILAAIMSLGLFNKIPGFWYNFFSWRGWHAMGRMSLSVLMVHWTINTCIAASRPQPISTSLLDVLTDFIATSVMSYLAAVPLTLMVEMPFLRVINGVFFSEKKVKQSYEQYSRFPRLFHLDDYEGCLLKVGGLYCMGDFQLSASGRNPTFDLMRAYSAELNNYNRTFIHRGYCVSERCPSSTSYNNSAARFALCAARWGKTRGLKTELKRLSYCKTHEEFVTDERPVETPHRVFLWAVGAVLMLNVIGTVYDLNVSGKKSRLLTSWSLANNWQHLVGPFPSGDPRLAALLPVEGGRVIVLMFTMMTHCLAAHISLYIQNPRYMEEMIQQPLKNFLTNGSSIIQMYILFSSFFLAQGMLREELSFRKLPAILMKRFLRIAPVCILAVGFAATWWPFLRSGSQWDPLVGAESAVCREKFWAHAFFLGNFFKDDQICFIQAWFIGVEMQLYVLSAVLTVLLAKCRRPLLVLTVLFVLANFGNFGLTFVYGIQAPMQYWKLQNIRQLTSQMSYRLFYIKPWSNLPTSLVGLFLAHLLHHLRGFHAQDHKLLILLCQLCMPLLPMWALGAGSLFSSLSGWKAALYTALERPVVSLLVAPLLFGALNGNGRKIDKSLQTGGKSLEDKPSANGFLHRLFSWRAWYPLGRMTLAVVMMHWCVLMTFVASRPALFNVTHLDMMVDFCATAVFTYILAVPVTLLLDIPMQQSVKAVTSPQVKKED